MKRGKFVTFFTVLTVFALLSGCSSDSSTSQTNQLTTDSTLEEHNSQVTSEGNETDEEQPTISQPGPFKDGEFGRIDLTQEQYDKLGQNDGKIVLDGGILIDVRNLWERENVGQPIEAEKALLVYEIRELGANGREDYGKRRPNPNFVKEVTDYVHGDKNRKIILICHSGSRTQKAAKLLSKNGFTNVYDIEGGYNEWEKRFSTRSYSQIYQEN